MMKKKIIIISAVCVSLALIVAAILVLFLHVIPKRAIEREQREFFEFLQQYYKDKSAGFAEENKTLGEVDVAFIGDSLTDGYDLKTYYPDMKVINRGIGGDTTHGVLARLDTSVIEPAPRVVVMMIGTNNLGDMFTDYEEILIKLKSELPDTMVVILSIPPASGEYVERNGQIAINNVKIKSLAEKYDYAYVDVFTPLFDFERNELRAEYTTDGIHFTPLGYEVITAEVKPVLEEIIVE
jgi:lysophospholipase L1-like esterase